MMIIIPVAVWLSDDTVRVAVALHLSCSICVTHTCHCGSLVDTHGLHGLVCKKAPSRTTRHYAVNDAIACSLTAAGIPVSKEPSGLTRTDGKRPDGLTLIPWQAGKPLTWDVTVVSTLADSHVNAAGIAGVRMPQYLMCKGPSMCWSPNNNSLSEFQCTFQLNINISQFCLLKKHKKSVSWNALLSLQNAPKCILWPAGELIALPQTPKLD